MFKRYWIIAVAFGLTLSAASVWPQSTSENEPRQEESTADANNNGNGQNNQAVDLTPALEDIETAIRDLIAEEDKIAAEAQQNREQRDLDAQEGMAWWAEWMFYATAATAATVVLTLTALIAIIRTLHHTRRAADAAETMADDTKSIGQAQVRAYISCDNAKFEIGDESVTIKITLRNSGQSPALQVRIAGTMFLELVGGHPEQPRILETQETDGSDVEFNAIPANTVSQDGLIFFKSLHFDVDTGQPNEALTNFFKEANQISVDATIFWDDVFGGSHKQPIYMHCGIDVSPYHPDITGRMQSGAMEIRSEDPLRLAQQGKAYG